jgi:hypothetical protein
VTAKHTLARSPVQLGVPRMAAEITLSARRRARRDEWAHVALARSELPALRPPQKRARARAWARALTGELIQQRR